MTDTNLNAWFDLIMGTPSKRPAPKNTIGKAQEQWCIVDKKSNRIMAGTNRDTAEECMYWFIEPEVLESPTPEYVKELWKEVSKREKVTLKKFRLTQD